MAAASLVATAFGIVIIIITAYVLAGSTLATSEVVTSAQKDMTDLQLRMLGTSIEIGEPPVNITSPLSISLSNTGNEPILVRDFGKMDVYLFFPGTGPVLYRYSSGASDGWWTDGSSIGALYPAQWDPGETMNIILTYSEPSPPREIQVTTPNGVSARRVFPYPP
jgi:flagellar protein FlaF